MAFCKRTSKFKPLFLKRFHLLVFIFLINSRLSLFSLKVRRVFFFLPFLLLLGFIPFTFFVKFKILLCRLTNLFLLLEMKGFCSHRKKTISKVVSFFKSCKTVTLTLFNSQLTIFEISKIFSPLESKTLGEVIHS